MRPIRLLFLLLILAAPLGTVTALAADDPLVSAAAAERRFVFAEFTSVSCPACDEMRPIVDELRAKYPGVVYQQIDADLEPGLSRRYGVKCVPVYVIVSPDGEVRFNDVGMRTTEELEAILAAAGVASPDPEE